MSVQPDIQPEHDPARASKLIVAADFCGAAVLSVVAICLSPAAFLPRIFDVRVNLRFIRMFLPYGMLSSVVQMAIDWQFGRLARLTTELESVIGTIEPIEKKLTDKFERRALMTLYVRLAHTYMISGQLEDAVLVVIRANKALGIERLPGMGELNLKTAQIIRAGIAAGRMLDSGGLAALFVKSPPKGDGAKKRRPRSTKRSGATARPKSPSTVKGKRPEGKQGATVIPFPAGK